MPFFEYLPSVTYYAKHSKEASFHFLALFSEWRVLFHLMGEETEAQSLIIE